MSSSTAQHKSQDLIPPGSIPIGIGEPAGQMIARDLIDPSPTNPRKTFNGLEELAASIEAQGILQAILVRPHPKRSGRYELVIGERRWRASAIAGLELLPGSVRNLTDNQVRELQLLENVQREDLSALEEAAGYADLCSNHGYTPETLAKQLGKSRSHVYGLMKLANLPDEASKAVESGVLPPSTAELIGRIPNDVLRRKAAHEILTGGPWDHQGGGNGRRLPMSFRGAKEHIASHYMVELKRAGFDREDPNLVPAAGPCSTCPKMSGNDPDKYPGARTDVCNDPECFREKVAAASKVVAARVEVEKGMKVLTGKEAEKALSAYGSDYVTMEKQLGLSGKNAPQTVKKLVRDEIGKSVKPVAVINPETLETRVMLPLDQVKRVAQKKLGSIPYSLGGSFSSGARRTKTPAEKRQEQESRIKAKATRRLAGIVYQRIKEQGFRMGVIPLMLKLLVGEVYDDYCKDALMAIDGVVEKKGPGNRYRRYQDTLAAKIPELGLGAGGQGAAVLEAVGVMAALMTCKYYGHPHVGGRADKQLLKSILISAQINPLRVENQVRGEEADKERMKESRRAVRESRQATRARKKSARTAAKEPLGR